MKVAKFWKSLDKEKVQCALCPKECVILPEKTGFCAVRKNIGGKLYSLAYEQPLSLAVDPVEKKPLFHFLPGTDVLSFGTVGCNLGCKFCQNSEMARSAYFEVEKVSAKNVVEEALNRKCKSIAYTYNEPTIFFEYVEAVSRLADEKGLNNIWVTNGYIQEKPLKRIVQLIDGVNVDLKGFTEDFYKKICLATLKPVLNSLKIYKEAGVWVEVTNLVIPTLNDDFDKIEEMCAWLKDNLGKDTPLHFSRFFPSYQLDNLPITPLETLEKAKKIADKYLDFVYIGNVLTEKGENTYCPKCKKLLVARSGFGVVINNIRRGRCPKCNSSIPGLWS
jgi:pyruvate formate lyase activating enzyme